MPISLSGWIGRVVLMTLLLLVAAIYARGSVLIPQEQRPKPWQMVAFSAGLILLAAALVSPLETLVARYYTARALQQLMLTEMIPFLLLGSGLFRPIFAGLPIATQCQLKRLRHNPVFLFVTMPAAAWLLFVSTFWFWHDATMIQLVSANGWVHVIEIATLLVVACLYWWHIIGADPRIHRPMSRAVRLVYAFIGILPIKLTGIVMLFGIETRVGGYNLPDENTLMVNFFGMPLADNTVGAIIIWVVGGIMYALAALLLSSRLLGFEEAKPPRPVNPIEDESLWVMPGVKRRPPRDVYQSKTVHRP